MFSPRSASRHRQRTQEYTGISPVLAANIAQEYAALRRPGALPSGVYVTASIESLLRWDGVLFVHDGPYAQAVLRFTLSFDTHYPRTAPTLRFETDVYHPMVDPKSKVWSPRGQLARWQSGSHHVVHLLQAVKAEFELSALESVTEEQAVNKQLYSLYKNSRQTFLSMTAQRSRQSASRDALYPGPASSGDVETIAGKMPASPTGSSSSRNGAVPRTPTKPSARVRLNSGSSYNAAGASSPGVSKVRQDGVIRFRQLSQLERDTVAQQVKAGRAQAIDAPHRKAGDPNADPFT